LSGKVDLFLGRFVFNSPEWEALELEPLRTRRIVPVYPLTEGLTAGKMREIMQRVSRNGPPACLIRCRLIFASGGSLYSLAYALQQLHFPDSHEAMRSARQRLAFDELFLLQLGRSTPAPRLAFAYRHTAAR
jgi:ATP-dependent DNA helicase RecG